MLAFDNNADVRENRMIALERSVSNPILSCNPDSPWEAGSVLNGTVVQHEGRFIMAYRATNDVQPDFVAAFPGNRCPVHTQNVGQLEFSWLEARSSVLSVVVSFRGSGRCRRLARLSSVMCNSIK